LSEEILSKWQTAKSRLDEAQKAIDDNEASVKQESHTIYGWECQLGGLRDEKEL